MAQRYDTSRIFNNTDKLHPSIDTTPIGRQKEINRIKEALEPMHHGHQANHLVVTGPPGTGKTTCVKHARDQITNRNTTDKYIKCTTHQTRSAALTQILRCNENDFYPDKRGLGVDEKLDRLQQYVDKEKNIVVILDECDRHQDLNALLYDLMQINAESENGIGIVLVTDRGPEGLGMEDRVWSRVNPLTVHFDRYGEERLYDIIADRVQDGFEDGVVADGVVAHLAEYVANDEDQGPGDVRCALDILRIAGQKVKREGKQQLTVADIEQVVEKFRQ